jgi:hypothetical protein
MPLRGWSRPAAKGDCFPNVRVSNSLLQSVRMSHVGRKEQISRPVLRSASEFGMTMGKMERPHHEGWPVPNVNS